MGGDEGEGEDQENGDDIRDKRKGKKVKREEEGMARATWAKVKSGFTGRGGYKKYLSVVALLMVMGKVEGGVGASPQQSWWAKGVKMAKDLLGEEAAPAQETVQLPVGSACPEVQ